MVATRIFRLFMSSTFSDFIAEREELQRLVFPRLERYCAERGARFQAVDLRWGITEEAQAEHDTMRICLEEVRRSQELSPRPNFAVLIGDRYGWEPAPARIPTDHWRRLLAAASPADRRVIRQAYTPKIDSNLVPPHYWLKRRGGDEPGATHEAREREARDALRRAADRAGLEGADRIPYFTSATHQEIVLGALQVDDAQDHVHVYVRRIEGLLRTRAASAFLDIDKATSAPVPGALDKLRSLEAELHTRLPGSVHTYTARWASDGTDNSHLKAFCEDFYRHQVALIDRELNALVELDASQDRQRQHDQFALERARNFSGRKALLARIRRYTDTQGAVGRRSQRALVLSGSGGSGKSALLARAYLDARHDDGVALCRFIGGLPATESLAALLQTLAQDIAHAYGATPPQAALNLRETIETFESALALASAPRPLMLFLDGLDQLDTADRSWMLEWLPARLPAHVRIVTSTRPGPIEWAAHSRCRVVEVKPMALSDARQMLRALLADTRQAHFNAGTAVARGYRLSAGQSRLLLDGFARSGRPLWLKLAYEEAITWRSWEAPRDLPHGVEALVEDLVRRRLTERENHPPVFAARALAYLAAGRFGLGEDELALALGTDPDVRHEFQIQEKTQRRWENTRLLPPILWSRLYFDLQPYLSQVHMDGTVLYRFFHREFKEAIERLFLASADSRREIHGRLADVFQARAPQGDDLLRYTEDGTDRQESTALRRVMEQPWQLARAGRNPELARLLSDFGFCMAKCALNRPADLIADYALLSDASQANTWRQFMVSRASLLYRGDRHWPASRILLQLASETPDGSTIGQAVARWLAGGWETRPWLRSQYRQAVAQSSIVLEGHQGPFTSFVALELEGRMLLSRHVDYRLWNLDTGECGASYPLQAPAHVVSSRPGSCFAHPPQGSSGEVLFWSATPGPIRFRHCDVEGMSMCNALELSDGRILSRPNPRIPQVWSATRAEAPCRLEGHDDDVTGFLELLDGRILTWGTDRSLRAWTLPPQGQASNGLLVARLDAHRAPILGAIQLPHGPVVSWDFAGGFVWSEWGEQPVSRFLEGLGYDSPPDRSAQREAYRTRYEADAGWQRGTLGSDHQAAGALWTTETGEGRLLAWKPGTLDWYGALGERLCRQEMGATTEDLTGVIHLPGFGTARTFDQDNKIVLQAYAEDASTTVEEPEAASISGILRLTDHSFCTWSGRKRGDSALRIWSAIEGDWHKGVQLHVRLEGHSRWIHTVSALQGRRIASCGEDDAIRVWDLDVREEDLTEPVAANSPRYIGNGHWRVHLHGYSDSGTRRPLVLVDGLAGQARVVDDIWYTVIPPEVTGQHGLCVVQNELVIDAKGEITPFESAADDDLVGGQSRAQARIEVIEPYLLLAVRRPQDETDAATDITAWVCGVLDSQYWEAAHLELRIPGLQPLVRLAGDAFAAWGGANRVEIWRVTLEDFGEQDVFQPVAQLNSLPSSPSGVVAVNGDQLMVWSEAGWLAHADAREGRILHRYDIPSLAGLEVAADIPALAWGADGRIWRIDPDKRRAQALACSPDTDVIGLVALTPERFISLSTDGTLRAWTVHGDAASSSILFPGRFMSRAQFFWSMDLHEDAGLPAGNPIRDAEGNVLMMTTFAPAAFTLLLFSRASQEIHLLMIDGERVKVFNAAQPEQPLCVWHFPRSSYRDPNVELGLSPSGDVLVLAGTTLQRLQMMRSAGRLRLDEPRA